MTRVPMHEGEVEVGEALVRDLLSAQFPALAGLALVTVEPWGTDHAIWRLGDELVLRFPRIGWAAGQPDFEARWLPYISASLPVAVPDPVAVGEPGLSYPHRWAVHRWLPGHGADLTVIDDPARFATDLADVVSALQGLDREGAPPAAGRALPLAHYDPAARQAIASAEGLIDTRAATSVWEAALTAPPYDGPPVWVHGDLEGNCLVEDGRLSGLVDWGSACAGDPAVDIQVIWSPLFTEATRGAFIDALGVDTATLARSRGAAVQQACAALPYYLDTNPTIVERSWHKLAAMGIPALDT